MDVVCAHSPSSESCTKDLGLDGQLFPRFDAVDGPLGRSGTASTIESPNPFTTNRPDYGLGWLPIYCVVGRDYYVGGSYRQLSYICEAYIK
jgi:hypothetical protein